MFRTRFSYLYTLEIIVFMMLVPPVEADAPGVDSYFEEESQKCLVDDVWQCEMYDEKIPVEFGEYSGVNAAANAEHVRQGMIPLRDAQLVNRLKPREGVDPDNQTVIFQDLRKEQTYGFNFEVAVEFINEELSLEAIIGDCSEHPQANCISLVDFYHPEELKAENVYAFTEFTDSHDRNLGFDIADDETVDERTYFHELGHALGLSHEMGAEGVMGYSNQEKFYDDRELEELRNAYPKNEVTPTLKKEY